jgi:Protein of unknown function (DUF3775)
MGDGIMVDIDTAPEIATEKVCFIIVKARQFDAKDLVTEPDPGSNPSDDRMIEILEEHRDDPVLSELTQFIDALDVDEQIDLVALTWLGRGDETANDWWELRAAAEQQHNDRTAAYLLGTPLLPDLLAEGLAKFDLSCEGLEEDVR